MCLVCAQNLLSLDKRYCSLVVVFVAIPAYDGSSLKKMGELLHNNIMPNGCPSWQNFCQIKYHWQYIMLILLQFTFELQVILATQYLPSGLADVDSIVLLI